MKKLIPFIFLFVTSISFSQSESTKQSPTLSKRWIAKLGVNMVRSTGDGSPFGSFSENALASPFSIGMEYKFSDYISVALLQSFNKWKADKGVLDGVPLTEDESYFSLDASVKFYFDEYFLDEEWLDLYLDGGIGYYSERESGISPNLGLGGTLWISQTVGLNVQGIGKFAGKDFESSGTNHFQYFAGLVYNFGGIDTDKDGILDSEDECPEVFGLIQFNGCPDSDGDGVRESMDECPLVYGPAELNGCPDKDNDGVADKNDECPNVKGSKNTRGCPDRDRDGIPDKFDVCPDTPGSAYNKGCPWKDTDKDGVLDKDDKCPNQIGPVNNSGCPYPKLSQVEVQKIDAYARTILFDLGKANLKPEGRETLNNVVVIMKNFPTERFHIAGHSDNTFTEEFNQTLSENRANNVRNYLISRGINPARLTSRGYGESRPIASNDLEEGRTRNRRVEIILVK